MPGRIQGISGVNALFGNRQTREHAPLQALAGRYRTTCGHAPEKLTHAVSAKQNPGEGRGFVTTHHEPVPALGL